jgi:hypothetical protein
MIIIETTWLCPVICKEFRQYPIFVVTMKMPKPQISNIEIIAGCDKNAVGGKGFE